MPSKQFYVWMLLYPLWAKHLFKYLQSDEDLVYLVGVCTICSSALYRLLSRGWLAQENEASCSAQTGIAILKQFALE